MATPFLTGKFGSATFAGTKFNVMGWKFEDKSDVKKINDTGGAGFSRRVVGFREGTGEVTAVLRTDGAPITATPIIAPGTRGALILEVDDTASTNVINIPEVVVTSLPVTSATDSEIKYSFSFETDGNWVELNGNTASNATF